MIGQYLSNTNENATVSIFQKFSELNKALSVFRIFNNGTLQRHAVCLKLSVKSVKHSVVFFSHNKLSNSIFSYDLSAKQTKTPAEIQIVFLKGWQKLCRDFY